MMRSLIATAATREASESEVAFSMLSDFVSVRGEPPIDSPREAVQAPVMAHIEKHEGHPS